MSLGPKLILSLTDLLNMLTEDFNIQNIQEVKTIVATTNDDDKFSMKMSIIKLVVLHEEKLTKVLTYEELLQVKNCSSLYIKYSKNSYRKFLHDFNLKSYKTNFYVLTISGDVTTDVDLKTGHMFSFHKSFLKVVDTNNIKCVMEQYKNILIINNEREKLRNEINKTNIEAIRKDDNEDLLNLLF